MKMISKNKTCAVDVIAISVVADANEQTHPYFRVSLRNIDRLGASREAIEAIQDVVVDVLRKFFKRDYKVEYGKVRKK